MSSLEGPSSEPSLKLAHNHSHVPVLSWGIAQVSFEWAWPSANTTLLYADLCI